MRRLLTIATFVAGSALCGCAPFGFGGWGVTYPEAAAVVGYRDMLEPRPGQAPPTRCVVRTFGGLLNLSPGLDSLGDELRALPTADCGPIWIAHSAGAADACAALRAGEAPPRVLVLLDPFPQALVIPAGPKSVSVIRGRPGEVWAEPGVLVVHRYVPVFPVWDATAGHLLICLRPEVRAAVRRAAER